MNKLKTRLILLTMGGSIFAIVLVSIIINITFFKQFDVYMEKAQEGRVEEVVDMIYNAYMADESWSGKALEYINLSPLAKNFDIIIKDGQNRVVFQNIMQDNTVDHHNNMMRRMGRGMMGRNTPATNDVDELPTRDNYVKKSYVIKSNDASIGTIDVGYIGPFNISESDVGFTRGINKSMIYAALISILISIVLGLYSSKIFSKPILKITDAANNIRRGNLDVVVDEDSSVIELKELSRSINHLSESLGEQEQLRKRLTSDISHELRTPLSVLQSHIEAIIDGVWEPTEERLNVCRNEVVRLTKLVEQLKYLTDIESHKIELEKENYNLSKDITEIIKSFEYQFAEKEVALNNNVSGNIFIEGDRDKIKQIVINLLSNAFKFTNAGGRVDVALEDKSEGIVIEIADDGIGIDKKDLPHLFERLYRSDISRNRKTGGSGIGLTITKTLVEAHGGTIRVESEKDRGTKVTVILPSQGDVSPVL